ncbi:hypothetical protein ACFQ2M_22845 [Kitasatospora saccharophila]|uniref:hypothetical protein n=1 Tax=Kitasatospora saccharophila TaxID=407973 RepID=UPI00362A9F6B
MSTAQVAAAVTGRGHDDILDLVMRPDLDFVADADGSRVIVVDPVRGRQLRMAGGAADLLRSLDGTRTTSSLMDDLGVDDPGPVDRALARFAELELTTTKAGAAAPPSRARCAAGATARPPSWN